MSTDSFFSVGVLLSHRVKSRAAEVRSRIGKMRLVMNVASQCIIVVWPGCDRGQAAIAARPFTPLCQCLSEETLKPSVHSIWCLMPGEVKYPPVCTGNV